MKKASLSQNTAPGSEQVLRALRAAYAGEIYRELTRLLGSADKEAIEGILEKVHVLLPELPPECDVSHLVFHCVRREAVRKGRSPVLKDAARSGTPSPAEDARLELVLTTLPEKQKKYFLDRYYYLREDVPLHPGYERTIARLFQGKGAARRRFRETRLPEAHIPPEAYAGYLDRLEPSGLLLLRESSPSGESSRFDLSTVSGRLAARQHRIARYAIPIACLLVLLGLLILFLFPSL